MIEKLFFESKTVKLVSRVNKPDLLLEAKIEILF